MKVEERAVVNLTEKEVQTLSDFYEMCNKGIFEDADFSDVWDLLESIHDNFNYSQKDTFDVSVIGKIITISIEKKVKN